MKNSNLFLLVAALFAFVSCGTANLTAQWGASQYRNGIYFSSSANVQTAPAQVYQQQYAQAEPEVTAVQEYVAPAAPALAAGESYEERLRKFDSPVYVINVDYVDLYPWWSMNFAWCGPGWRWHHSWYARPYWDFYWADSWWHNHYWYGHHWYDHYWHNHFWPSYHRPGYHHPHHRPHGPVRDVYYGKRDYTTSYRDMNRRPVTVGSKSPMGTQYGSATRRGTDVRGNGAVMKGQPAGQPGKQTQQTQQTRPQYRRTTDKSGSTDVKKSETEKTKATQSSSHNEYRRSSSSQQFNRSGSSAPTRSNYSSGGGGSRSGGSSSGSYRRR